MSQLDLLAATPASRNTDPNSSHLAADDITQSGVRARQQRMVLNAVRRWPGLTSRELAARMNICRYVTGRRLSELSPVFVTRPEKATRACTVTGRLAVDWWPTPAAGRRG